jgi:hypothetical protein
MNKEKTYTLAPLPFQGQKRHHVREFTKIVKQVNPPLIVDLFGGSGLLSHVAKRACPQARVIYNDYDRYRERLAHVEQTNELLRYCRNALKGYPRSTRITGKLREDILRHFACANKSGFVDWITISSCLCFSMKYANKYEELAKRPLYNRVRLADYSASGYLNGLEVVRMDYRQLCEQYRNVPDALFIVDPPYLSTDTSTYSSDGYWQLRDYLNVLTVLSGLQFVYFTSSKSQIVELSEWLGSGGGKVGNVLQNAAVRGTRAHATHRFVYDDLMITNAVKPNLK